MSEQSTQTLMRHEDVEEG